VHACACAQGGLPALLLRLAADGHAALEVVGPPGTAALVTAASLFVKWVHPKARARARTHVIIITRVRAAE
jgi:hypothetical protein